MDANTTVALANEARRQEARNKVSRLVGAVDATAGLAAAISTTNTNAVRDLAAAREELAALEGGGPGLTADFGEFSTLEQAMREERFAGKAAAVDFMKANANCTEDEAEAAYTTAALAARPPDRQWLLIDPGTLWKEYAANLVALGLTPDATWESYRAWIVATPKETILGL